MSLFKGNTEPVLGLFQLHWQIYLHVEKYAKTSLKLFRCFVSVFASEWATGFRRIKFWVQMSLPILHASVNTEQMFQSRPCSLQSPMHQNNKLSVCLRADND